MDDPILKGRRYVLGATERHYAIWDRHAGVDPVERFPGTEEGFDAAEKRFYELRRLERRERGVAFTALWITVALGASLWLAAGVIGALVAVGVPFGLIPPDQVGFFGPLYLVDAFGYRAAIGAFLVLAAVLLTRWERRTRGSDEAATPLRIIPVRGTVTAWEAILRWAFMIGLGVWVLTALPEGILYPRGARFDAIEPHPLFIATQIVGSVAFRLWVAALLLLVLRWIRIGGSRDADAAIP